MNPFNLILSPYLKYYGLIVLFVKTETTKSLNDTFRLFIFDTFYPSFSGLANFGKRLRRWTKPIILEK